MKRYLFGTIIFVMAAAIAGHGQTTADASEVKYDEEIAKKVGADEFGLDGR